MRTITQDDVDSATRGLGLQISNRRELERKIRDHKHSDLFASRVIVIACEVQLRERFGQ